MKMLAGLALVSALLFSANAEAAAVVKTAFDPSPADFSCDNYTGFTPPRARNCYIPAYGASQSQFSAYGPAHNNPAFSISVTLTQPTTVEITYDQDFFLDTHYGTYPAYISTIGVDSTTVPCGVQAEHNLDSAGSTGFTQHAICVVTLDAGPHTFYALEAARQGASAFHAAVNQLLVVRYDQP